MVDNRRMARCHARCRSANGC